MALVFKQGTKFGVLNSGMLSYYKQKTGIPNLNTCENPQKIHGLEAIEGQKTAKVDSRGSDMKNSLETHSTKCTHVIYMYIHIQVQYFYK